MISVGRAVDRPRVDVPGGMSISIPIRGRGTVGILDLLTLLANWGAVRVRQTPKRRNAECHEPKPRESFPWALSVFLRRS